MMRYKKLWIILIKSRKPIFQAFRVLLVTRVHVGIHSLRRSYMQYAVRKLKHFNRRSTVIGITDEGIGTGGSHWVPWSFCTPLFAISRLWPVRVCSRSNRRISSSKVQHFEKKHGGREGEIIITAMYLRDWRCQSKTTALVETRTRPRSCKTSSRRARDATGDEDEVCACQNGRCSAARWPAGRHTIAVRSIFATTRARRFRVRPRWCAVATATDGRTARVGRWRAAAGGDGTGRGRGGSSQALSDAYGSPTESPPRRCQTSIFKRPQWRRLRCDIIVSPENGPAARAGPRAPANCTQCSAPDDKKKYATTVHNALAALQYVL